MIEGESGIGKTALLECAIDSAGGFRIVSGVGVQAEQELPFAGLQQLLADLPDYSDDLPEPQSRAIRVALGLADDPAPSPLLVGLALLSLFTEASRDRPLLCVVDDVHWLDGSTIQALGFVARRTQDIPVAMLFVKRSGLDVPDLDSTPVLPVPGLNEQDSLALLHTVVVGPMDHAIALRIVEEARGNPLLIREFARESGSTDIGVTTHLSDASLPIASRLERAFANRSARLPDATSVVLLLAAADPTGDPRLLARAAPLLGSSVNDLIPAEAAGLVRVGRRITFEHPLVRSGVYERADPEMRRRVHDALARATDRQRDPDRRAWHSALGTFGLSETVAAALEHSAGRAGARGGFLAAAAFYERAAQIAELPATRVRCALAAAGALELAGSQPRALRILDDAHEYAADDETRARIDLVRGHLLFTLERSERPVELFLSAASVLAASDVPAAREAYLDALSAATLAAAGPDGSGIRDAAARTLAAPVLSPEEARATDHLLDVMRGIALDPPTKSLTLLKRHLREFSDADDDPGVRARWLWVASRLAAIGWDEDLWRAFVGEGVAIARAAGALTAAAASLSTEAAVELLSGDGVAARQSADEAIQIWNSIQIPPAPYGAVVVAAWEGSPESEGVFSTALNESTARGEGMGVPLVHWATALHANANGRYAEAVPHAQAASRFPLTILYSTWGLVELVEAGARTGDRQIAQDALDRLRVSTRAAGTDWARGVEARASALLELDPQEAEQLHAAAVRHLSRTGLRAELARAQLVYGEWLRRQRRRADARAQLEAALTVFAAMNAHGFASRARSEIAALGRGHGHRDRYSEELSTQEATVARLASEGLSNTEIAVRLHLSASTVDYHLRKTFRKLGIASRSRLHLALAERGEDGGPRRLPVSDDL